MNISDIGIEFIREHEGCKLTAYQDTVGVWTIGVGHTKDVQADDAITDHQADVMLRNDLDDVEKCIDAYVKVNLDQCEFDALCSFVFNLGCGNFKKSTLLAQLNVTNRAGAADEFLRWNKAGGKVLAGLTRRREAERELFLS